MPTHQTFHSELDKLNKKLLTMGAMVEDRVRKAVTVIETHDEEIITSIIRSDYQIDDMEVEIEEDCLKILALHQPVASDLRFLITVIKINNEIERIGDMAVNIAKRVNVITQSATDIKSGFDYGEMSEHVINMLRMSLDALVHRDAAMARQIFLIEEKVNEIRNQAYDSVLNMLTKYPEHPGCMISNYLLARHLERIADRATNIAEEVIYLVEGEIVRLHI
ncbi:MAG: phosphate signaling complex protein PhoU [Deltaproteobacteria bacterium]|nr:phosphate signaling complex protein PhoU [Deltaproteobacteria bacterium]